MLYDRDYMRNPEGGYWRSPVTVLLVVLGVLFLLECLTGGVLGQTFGLSAEGIRRHQYWRLVTYEFLHVAPWPWHLLFNALGLWFFGRAVLEALGPGRFWQIYLASGFVGGLAELLVQLVRPSAAYTVGASACVLGLAGAFCFLFPARENVFFLYFVPVRLRSMTLFWILLVFSAFGAFFLSDGVAYGAHLGGLLTGVAMVRLWHDEAAMGWLRRLRRESRRSAARREEVSVPAGKGSVRGPVDGGIAAAPETPEDFIRREVDPILDKISAHGIQSLTEKERRILEKARERMSRK